MSSRFVHRGILFLFVAQLGLFVGCGSSDSAGDAPPQTSVASPPDSPATDTTASEAPSSPAGDEGTPRVDLTSLSTESTPPPPPPRAKPNQFPEVLITTNKGEIKVKLNAKDSPRTVENFLENYVDLQLYDKSIIHYVQAGVMIAGGGFQPDYTPLETRGELLNEADNGLSNKAGTLAMYRHPQAMNSATSQFFFNLCDNPSLDHQGTDSDEQFGYCVFGEVIDGMDVLQRIGEVEVADREEFPSTPVEPVIIESIQRVK